ncbi:MAG: AHH domain-containing protein [Sphingomonadales bacterium]|nr:AHH domain-containing protein [Sphingomonadales bacterium]
MPFHAVNRPGDPTYQADLQRHHLLPLQLLGLRMFAPLFDAIGRSRIGFDDFRSNGLLLPASAATSVRIGLPLHRGPHRHYSALVIERVGQIEAAWSVRCLRAPDVAGIEAVQRLHLLQAALRRRLLEPGRKPLALNRHDPLGRHQDYGDLDAMVDALWPATG